jgi:hypothetical protein
MAAMVRCVHYSGQFDSSAIHFSDNERESWQQSATILRTPTPDIDSSEAQASGCSQLRMTAHDVIRTQIGRFYDFYSAANGANSLAAVPAPLISSHSSAGMVRLEDARV